MLRASSSFRLTSAVLRCISRPTSDAFHRRCNRNLAQNRATSPPRSLHRRNLSTCSENVAHNGVSPTLLRGLDTQILKNDESGSSAHIFLRMEMISLLQKSPLPVRMRVCRRSDLSLSQFAYCSLSSVICSLLLASAAAAFPAGSAAKATAS